MPPPTRVCAACKACKTKCVDFSPGIPCKRCTRLGLRCEPASQKRQKHHAFNLESSRDGSSLINTQFAPVLGSVVSTRSAPLAEADTSELIMKNMDQPDVQIFCLRHMAQIARQRNAYTLMERVVSACKTMGLKLTDVLNPPSIQTVDKQTGSSPHPNEILMVVNASAGYCNARTVDPNGENYFFSNAAFEMDILSSDRIHREYERNEREILSIFIKEEDLETVRKHVGNTWRQAAVNSGRLMSSEIPGPVHLLHGRLSDYIACTMRVSVLIHRDSGVVSGAMEFLPLNVTQVRLPQSQELPQVPALSSQPQQQETESVVSDEKGLDPLETFFVFDPSNSVIDELMGDLMDDSSLLASPLSSMQEAAKK